MFSKPKNEFEEFYLDKPFVKMKNRLLAFSLMWFSIGLLLVIGFTFLVTFSEKILIFYLRFMSYSLASGNFAIRIISYISVVAINFALVWSLARYNQRANWGLLIGMFIAFIIIQSLWMPFLFWNLMSFETWKIITIISIPFIAIMVIGALGYFNVINFASKISIYLIIILSVITIGCAIALFFVTNDFLITLYCSIGLAATFLIVGFTFNNIRRDSDDLLRTYGEYGEKEVKRILVRTGLLYGLNLLVSFIQILWYLSAMSRK